MPAAFRGLCWYYALCCSRVARKIGVLADMTARRAVRKVLAQLGYSIHRAQSGIGGDAFADIHTLINRDRPLIFDVGANVGQSIDAFRSWFPDGYIHSFEPSPTIFKPLKAKVERLPNVACWNMALGSEPADGLLNENSMSEWSSLLPLDSGWGSVVRQTSVPVRTVDSFSEEHRIAEIDLLKSDTQGFELEVLRGARKMLQEARVGLIYCEIIFTQLYKGVPPFTAICNFLLEHGFSLVSFYNFSYTEALTADWADALFIHSSRMVARGDSVSLQQPHHSEKTKLPGV